MASATVTTAGTIIGVPLYPPKSFNVGDTIDEQSPYYSAAVNGGLVFGISGDRSAPAIYTGNPQQGQSLRYSVVKGAFEPYTPSNSGGTGGSNWPAHTYHIGDFVPTGSSLSNPDGTPVDISPFINNWKTAMVGITRPRQLYIPDGIYKLLTKGSGGSGNTTFRYSILWQDKLGIIGESKFGTILQTDTDSSPFVYRGASQISDCVFENFTIDGSLQDNIVNGTGGYTVYNKAFFMQDLLRPVWRNIHFNAIFSSALGCDFMQDFLIENISGQAGRGIKLYVSDPATQSGGSLVGIGTGKYQYEGGLISGIDGRNCGRGVVFSESLHENGFYSRGVQGRGIKGTGCWTTLQDTGWDSAHFDGVDADANKYGIAIAETILQSKAGKNLYVQGANLNRNTGADVLVGNLAGQVPVEIRGIGRSTNKVAFTGNAVPNLAGVEISLTHNTANDVVPPTGTLFADNFVATDGTTLSGRTLPDGSNTSKSWSILGAGTYAITGNAAKSGGSGSTLAVVDTVLSNGNVIITPKTLNATAGNVIMGICMCVGDENNYIQLLLRAGSAAGFTLNAKLSSGTTGIFTVNSTAPAVGTPIKIFKNGNALSVFNGATLVGTGNMDITARGAALVNNTRHGIFQASSDTTSTIDDFAFNTATS